MRVSRAVVSTRLDLKQIDGLIHSPVRLAIVATLFGGDEVDFTWLRDRLELTDGNLATHLRKLEAHGYVRCRKSFVGRRPRSRYRITTRGRDAFERHVEALERIVASTREPIHSPNEEETQC